MQRKKSKPFKNKRPERSKRRFLERSADDIYSLWIRERDGWQCYFRGKDNVSCAGPMQNNHIFSRSHLAIRLSDFNCVCGCAGHNLYYRHHAADLERLFERWDPQKYALAQAGKTTSGKRSGWELEMIIKETLKKIYNLKTNGQVLDDRTMRWINDPKHARFCKGL